MRPQLLDVVHLWLRQPETSFLYQESQQHCKKLGDEINVRAPQIIFDLGSEGKDN